MQLCKPAIILVFLASFLCISSLKAQDQIHYTFKVADVNSLATAKPVTALIRSYFNTEDEPNKYFPAFNVSKLRFDFTSAILVSESVLSGILLEHGYTLSEFTAESTNENKTR